jgi:hypothetical protein
VSVTRPVPRVALESLKIQGRTPVEGLFHLNSTYCNYNQRPLKKLEKNEIFAAPGLCSD